MDSIGLVVPVMNNFKGFAELMASVDYPAIFPIVIDNWNENRGVSWAWNAGIMKSISFKYCLIVNDDVTFYPSTIFKLMVAINSGRIFVTGNSGNGEYQYGTYNNEPDFSCFMINPIEFVKKYGWFDEENFPIYFNDNDMARRMLLTGDKYEKRLDARIEHKGSITQNNVVGGVETSPIFEQRRAKYVQKWGGGPLEEKFTIPFNGE